MRHPVPLHTPRLLLTTLDAGAAPQVLDYLLRNQAFFAPWNPRVSEAYFTLEAQRDRLAADLETLDAERGVRFWLFARDDARCQRVLGDIGVSNIVYGAFLSCHLGYKIDAAQANAGLMTEALRAVVAFTFDALGLHRIEANIMPRNARSRRVLEKLGFEHEGLARKYLKINGVWEDHEHYVLLNPRDDL